MMHRLLVHYFGCPKGVYNYIELLLSVKLVIRVTVFTTQVDITYYIVWTESVCWELGLHKYQAL